MAIHKVMISSEAVKHAIGHPEGVENPTQEQLDSARTFVNDRLEESGFFDGEEGAAVACRHGVRGVFRTAEMPKSDREKYEEGWERIFGDRDE